MNEWMSPNAGRAKSQAHTRQNPPACTEVSGTAKPGSRRVPPLPFPPSPPPPPPSPHIRHCRQWSLWPAAGDAVTARLDHRDDRKSPGDIRRGLLCEVHFRHSEHQVVVGGVLLVAQLWRNYDAERGRND